MGYPQMRSRANDAVNWSHGGFILESTGRGPLGRLRLQRRCIGSQIKHILHSKFFHCRLHQHASSSCPCTMFEVVELSHNIARRAACDAWNRPQTFQGRSVANTTLHRLAVTAISGKGLTLLNAARRNIHGESGMRVPTDKLLQVIRHFDDSLPDGLRFSSIYFCKVGASNICFWNNTYLHNPYYRSGLY